MKISKNIPFLLLAIISMLAGILAGLERLGWILPFSKPQLSLYHGPIMICGFLGTLISLERAVALKKPLWFLAPISIGLGSLLIIILPESIFVGQILILSGSFIFILMGVEILRKAKVLSSSLLLLGVLLFFCGNLTWLINLAIPKIVGLWAGFLILTIVGERIELSKFLQLTSKIKFNLLFSIILFVIGVFISVFNLELGQQFYGPGMFLLAVWLLRYDMSTKGWRNQGLTKFISISLISGFIWLAVSGIIAFSFAGQLVGQHYDALLHTLFLGFVFSMIFGHAPIIFPTILNVKISFRSIFYIHLILLHLTLLIRIFGDFYSWTQGRYWSGMLNGVAIILFFVNTIVSIIIPPKKQTTQLPDRAA